MNPPTASKRTESDVLYSLPKLWGTDRWGGWDPEPLASAAADLFEVGRAVETLRAPSARLARSLRLDVQGARAVTAANIATCSFYGRETPSSCGTFAGLGPVPL